MSVATSMPSSTLSESSRSDAQDNVWRGPAASTSLLPNPRPPASSLSSARTIRRKPVPQIPVELLELHSGSNDSAATLISSTSLRQEKSLPTLRDVDATPTQETAPTLSQPAPSTQRPQQQYILDIDAPASSSHTDSATDDTVKQLLRSTTTSPSAAPRTRKGPLRWMHEKEEHIPSPSAAAPTLTRKTSISAHLKLGLRRNKSDEPASTITISGPTNFVHVSTGTEGVHSSAAAPSLRRAATVSPSSNRSSVRSSISSNWSVVSGTSDDATSVEPEQQASDDQPLYTTSDRKHPLRPLKSIRRPSKIALQQQQEEQMKQIPVVPTSPRDKRKAIYAAPGSVPAILEPINVVSGPNAQASKLSPVAASPVASQAGENFAAALDRTLGRAHRLGSEGGAQSPEPELSRSPSSGYASSNRSSLGSLHEFRSFLDFPDMPPGSRRNSNKSSNEEDIWATLDRGSRTATAPALAVPIVLTKF